MLAQLYIITLISFPWVSGQLGETFPDVLSEVSLALQGYCSVLTCASLWNKKLHAGAGVSFSLACSLVFRNVFSPNVQG